MSQYYFPMSAITSSQKFKNRSVLWEARKIYRQLRNNETELDLKSEVESILAFFFFFLLMETAWAFPEVF